MVQNAPPGGWSWSFGSGEPQRALAVWTLNGCGVKVETTQYSVVQEAAVRSC